MNIPESQILPHYVRPLNHGLIRLYDFETCNGADDLKAVLAEINRRGFDVVSLTHDGGVYTVLFRRSQHE